MKKNCKKFLPIFFFKIFCIKHFWQKRIVKNTCEFYNFVENNYSQRNYLLIKI